MRSGRTPAAGRTQPTLFTLLGATLFIGSGGGCGGGCDRETVAEVADRDGQVSRTAGDGAWQAAEVGDRLVCDDGVRTAADSRAELAIRGTGRVELDGDTELYLRCSGREARFELQLGQAQLRAPGDGDGYRLTLGAAVITGRGTLRVRARDDGSTSFEVMVGQAIINRGGETESVQPGQGFALALGAAVPIVSGRDAAAEPAVPNQLDGDGGPAPDALPDAVGAAEVAAEQDAGPDRAAEQGPARADVVIRAGESPTIHDPRPPTTVAIDYAGLCPDTADRAVVEVSRSRRFGRRATTSAGVGRSNVTLGRRRYRYRVRCVRDGVTGRSSVANGVIRVVRDRATRRL
ncbi:MAG: FecR domain-containing protein, partial [Myxococcota bacterium]